MKDRTHPDNIVILARAGQLRDCPPEELSAMEVRCHNFNQNLKHSGDVALQCIKDERERRKEEQREKLAETRHVTETGQRAEMIEGGRTLNERVADMERIMKRPALKQPSNWIASGAFIVAVLAWLFPRSPQSPVVSPASASSQSTQAVQSPVASNAPPPVASAWTNSPSTQSNAVPAYTPQQP